MYDIKIWLLCALYYAVTGFSIVPDVNEAILAIASYDSEFVAAYSSKIMLYVKSKGEEASKVGEIALPEEVPKESGFVELKLINHREAIYCGTNSCGYCNFSYINTLCKKLSLVFDGKSSEGLTSVSMILSNRKLLIRLHDSKRRGAILSYNIDDRGTSSEINVAQYALDISKLSLQFTAASFSRGDYVYFAGSNYQSYDPLTYANLPMPDTYHNNQSIVKITRVCTKDRTPTLDSRMDLHLGCIYAATTGATYYDPVRQQMWLTMKRVDGTGNFCLFNMRRVDEKFDETWRICHSDTATEDCSKVKGRSEMKNHCHIFNRRTNGSLQTCETGNRNYNNRFANCEIDQISTAEHPYGWLEQYAHFQGDRLIAYDHSLIGSTQILPVNEDKNAILVSGAKKIYWASVADNSIISEVLEDIFDVPSSRHSIAILGNTLLFIKNTKIHSTAISCEGLFRTCETVIEEGWKSPGNCVWCPDEDINKAVSLKEQSYKCKQPLRKMCPPTIQRVVQTNTTRFELLGTNFSKMLKGTVNVCSKQCYIRTELSDDGRLICFLNNSIDNVEHCEILLTLILGDYGNFTVKAPNITLLNDEDRNTPMRTSSVLQYAITAFIIICVLVISLEASILAFYRCRPNQRNIPSLLSRFGINRGTFTSSTGLLPSSDSPLEGSVTDDSLNMQILATPDANDITTLNFTDLNMYQRSYDGLFRDIDIELCTKIDSSKLYVETVIGQGHFGVVNRAIYTNTDGTKEIVACKMIKPGVSGVREFFTEGITMGKFKHPHVIHLIGIAFTDSKIPVIITDYMANGDLLAYLKKRNTAPSVRRLLKFAVEIAGGMEYLHSMKFIHRDLAARNCMLDINLKVKIADFGLARECMEGTVYLPSMSRNLPFAWMPLEALQEETFSTKGDIWAYGIVLWELMTLGQRHPYGQNNMFEVLLFLKDGRRLEIPDLCPQKLYDEVMWPCWDANMDERPSFATLVFLVNAMMKKLPADSADLNTKVDVANNVPADAVN